MTAKWCTKGNVNLETIYSDLPNFIKEMKRQSCREDLEWLIKHNMALTDKEKDSLDSSTPHTLEIDNDDDENNDDEDGDDDCDHDGEIITEDSTIRIVEVRPFEFEKYVRNHGHRFPVISLPQEEI